MKKYMVVAIVENVQIALFADDYEAAMQKKQDCECGYGGYAELYGREEHEDSDQPSEYILIEA